ncbi:MAG: hypothetical protein ACLTE2_09575 [Eubacteriales bacterium]
MKWSIEGATVYHAGTKKESGEVLYNGGRVLGVNRTDTTFNGGVLKKHIMLFQNSF